MENSNKVVVGIFPTRLSLESAINALQANGFRSADVSALLPSNESTKDFAHINASKIPEGAAIGSTSGMVVGGALGWLAGIGALAVPGIGPFLAAGPIAAMFATAAAAGAVGGLTGALIGWGFPEYEARRYEGHVREGGYLLSVHCDNSEWASRAEDIMENANGHDITTSGESNSDSNSRIEDDKPRDISSSPIRSDF